MDKYKRVLFFFLSNIFHSIDIDHIDNLHCDEKNIPHPNHSHYRYKDNSDHENTTDDEICCDKENDIQ